MPNVLPLRLLPSRTQSGSASLVVANSSLLRRTRVTTPLTTGRSDAECVPE